MPRVHLSFKPLLFAAAVVLLVVSPSRARAQASGDELAAKADNYRLTEPSLRKFISATRQLAAAGRRDPAVVHYFSDGEGVQPAAVTRALSASGMSTEEYILFFVASTYAGMAQIVLDSDHEAAKRDIPRVVRLNAAFVRKHQAEYEAMRADLAVLQGKS